MVNQFAEFDVKPLVIQQPASAFFSLVTLCQQMNNYFWYQKERNVGKYRDYPYHFHILVYIGLWCATYLSSMCFHTDDNPTTEKMDYFCVHAALVWMCYFVTIRVFNLRGGARYFAGVPLFGFLIHHIWYMSFVKFDYGWHVVTGGVLMLYHTVVWVYYALVKKPSNRWQIIIAVLLMFPAVPWELLDFVPFFRIFDGHSLWHASGIYLVWAWFKVMETDVLAYDEQYHRKGF